MIRVLVAEDSAVTRELLMLLLSEDPALSVVATARNGREATRLAARLRPDVVLMDVHMPELDGYEATRWIMENVPTPIVMMSASTAADETTMALEALRVGAVTLLAKPPGPGHPDHVPLARELIETVKLMAEVKVIRRRSAVARERRPPPVPHGRRARLVAIGASTGGPQVLAQILADLPRDLACPILVVQHIAPGFVAGLARWLGEETALAVKLAEQHEGALPGIVYLAPDGHQMAVDRHGRIRLSGGSENGFCPSISYLFRTAAESFGAAAVGVLLSGMGADGAEGLRRMRDAGAITVAQDKDTSVIFGMPGEAVRLGAATHVLPPARVASLIRSLVGEPEGETG
jgi:two-component system chemotaxis response regulator CheB